MQTPELIDKARKISHLVYERDKLKEIINRFENNECRIIILDNKNSSYMYMCDTFDNIALKHLNSIKENTKIALKKINNELKNLIN